MLRRIPAAALLLALGACTVGPNYAPPEWLSPASWFAKKAEPIPREPSVPVAEPIDPNWWKLFNDPVLTELEHRVAGENLDVQVATVRIAESRAQLGVAGAAQFPDAQRQRLLHAAEGERCRRVRQRAERARRQRRVRQHGGRHSELASQPVRRLSGWLRCLVGTRSVGRGAAFGGIRDCVGRGVGRGAAGDAAQQSGGTGARLHAVAWNAIAVADRARQPEDLAAEPAAHAAARGGWRDHRSRRGQCRRAGAHDGGADPATRAAGV